MADLTKCDSTGAVMSMETLERVAFEEHRRLAGMPVEPVLTPEGWAAHDAQPGVGQMLVLSRGMLADLLMDLQPAPKSEEEARLLRARCEGEAERWGKR